MKTPQITQVFKLECLKVESVSDLVQKVPWCWLVAAGVAQTAAG